MKHTIFCGCSYVEGDGLDQRSQDPDLWVNIVHHSSPLLCNTVLVNLGNSGSTNTGIFLTALASLAAYPAGGNLFVSWTNTKRLHVNPGLELYNTGLYLENGSIDDVKLNPGYTIPGSYVENIRDRFFSLTHHHYDLVEVLYYSSLINVMAQRYGTQCFFVNSLLNIDKNYFEHIVDSTRSPSQTTELTQQILQLETRDDAEFFALYDKIHQDYSDTQALKLNWLNLDQAYRKFFYVDKGSDNLHPGKISNRKFADHIIQKLQQYTH